MVQKTRVAINGFGRIGRAAFRIAFGKNNLEIVAINDLTDNKTLAHLLKYDSVFRTYDKKVGFDGKNLVVNGKKIPCLAEKDPSKLPWKKLGVDVVLECTGAFREEKEVMAHIKAGAKKIIISAPVKGDGVNTYVLGVNSANYKGEKIIDNASCTTNCISPVVQVIQSKFGILKATMTTIHSYTADQRLIDAPHKDLRRARAAGVNMIPTTTGAAVATTKTIPELKGLFDGLSIRVPTIDVSISDITMLIKKNVTEKEVNNALITASKTPRYKGILAVTEEELVSGDFIANPASAIVDLALTKVVDGNLLKVVAWYDNEWGYSNRLVEMISVVNKK
ncbi:MAG: type I glyceraldehyde-3-phosphate dehydrogenase [Patescibacteria group bacterium]|jgi:glyceraldehyde 3-phosphate dehydrogenase